MDYLLDTHAVIWFMEGDAQLSPAARIVIEHPRNRSFVSMASLWEIAIKTGLGKLTLAKPLTDVLQGITDGGMYILPVDATHVLHVQQLPFHHRDPFDRMLIAQASTERLTLVSRDAHFGAYAVPVVW